MRGLPNYSDAELYGYLFQGWERDRVGYSTFLRFRKSTLETFVDLGHPISSHLLTKVTHKALDYFVDKGALLYDAGDKCWWMNKDYDEYATEKLP